LSGSTDAFARNAALFRAAKKPRTIQTASRNLPLIPPFLPQTETRRIDIEKAIEYKPQTDASVCAHLSEIKKVFPSAAGCEECLRTNDSWVHLRICLTCGHLGCCDDSKNKHATAHFHASEHPIIKSMERGEDWAWCYKDEVYDKKIRCRRHRRRA
jgi:monovalent cation:H+ antiporter-2, CPA2 family